MIAGQSRRLHDEILQEYVDDELDSATRLEVAQVLAESPDDQAAVEAYHAQAEALHHAYGTVLDEPVPERLLATVRGTEEQPRDNNVWQGNREFASASSAAVADAIWKRAAVMATTAVALVAVSGAVGWQVRDALYVQHTQQLAVETFLQHATHSYSLYGQQDTPWSTSPVSDSSEFASSFSKTAGINVAAPDLSEVGYQFVGAWALPSDTGPAGQLVYRNEAGKRVAVYFQVTDPESGSTLAQHLRRYGQRTSRSFAKRDDLSVYYWNEGAVNYAVLGPLEKESLASLADTVLAASGQ